MDISLGMAVELPGGVYNVVGVTRYSASALDCRLWQLDSGEGQTALLAGVGETFYTPVLDAVDALPDDPQVTVNDVSYALRGEGEARAEKSAVAAPGESRGRSDFWLARYRFYTATGKVALFTADKDGLHRLLGEELAPGLVQVYKA